MPKGLNFKERMNEEWREERDEKTSFHARADENGNGNKTACKRLLYLVSGNAKQL